MSLGAYVTETSHTHQDRLWLSLTNKKANVSLSEARPGSLPLTSILSDSWLPLVLCQHMTTHLCLPYWAA